MVIREGGRVTLIYDEATARLALSSSPAVPSDDVGVYATVSKAVQQSLEGLIGHKVNGLQSACAEVRRKCQLSDGDKKTLAHIRDLQAATAFSRHFTRLGRLAWMGEVESLIARLKTSPGIANDCSTGSQAVQKKKPSSKQRRSRRLAKAMDLDLDINDEWADGVGVVAGVAALTNGPQPAGVAACNAQAVPARATRILERTSSDERTPKRAAPGRPADVDDCTAVQPGPVLTEGDIAEIGAVDSRPELRGQKVLLEKMSDDRWIVVLKSGERVRLKPDKLQPIVPSAQQWSHTMFSAK